MGVTLVGDRGALIQALSAASRMHQVGAAGRALEPLAQAIEDNAKRRLGHYQQAVDAFPAWQTLAVSTQAERVAAGYTPDDPLLASGALRDALTHTVAPDGMSAEIGIPSGDPSAMAGIAAEVGTATEPQRAFLGPAAYEEMARVGDYVRPIIKSTLGKP